jgi:hypothetical protein
MYSNIPCDEMHFFEGSKHSLCLASIGVVSDRPVGTELGMKVHDDLSPTSFSSLALSSASSSLYLLLLPQITSLRGVP